MTADIDLLPVMFSGLQICCLRRSMVGAIGNRSGRTWLVEASTVSSSANGGNGWLLYTIRLCVPRIDMCLSPAKHTRHQSIYNKLTCWCCGKSPRKQLINNNLTKKCDFSAFSNSVHNSVRNMFLSFCLFFFWYVFVSCQICTHTHTLCFNGHFSRWTWVSRLPP